MSAAAEEEAALRVKFRHHYSCAICRGATVERMERWRTERHWIPVLHAAQWLWEEGQLSAMSQSRRRSVDTQS